MQCTLYLNKVATDKAYVVFHRKLEGLIKDGPTEQVKIFTA